MQDDKRLERIETKLDEMSKAIVALARVEERLGTLFYRLDAIDKDRVDQGKRLVAVEKNTGSNGQSLRSVERVFWIVFTAGAAYFIGGIS
jgi:hypothetical protein